MLAGLIGFGVGYITFDNFYRYVPELPILAGVTLLVLALIELGAAISIRGRIAAGRVRTALLVARFVILAKASSLLGAIMLGGWLGALLFLVLESDRIVAAGDDVPSAIVGAVCAAVLIGAALWLEHCCRTPEEEDHHWTGNSS